ncbi:sensor histidine kinase [Fibrivirga algicola]|uniref:histidine kinase n=1 Tax=Fibrivirga algicola TaxID=2950420 RepID=A0ABX0QCV3_9BACT|nr:ATP-binding protein [Fibrivirga algicola]NID09961.1 two-component sensor histidine kinase [Fibrivirga algicola]
MSLSPRFIALILALLIAGLTMAFLAFVPGTNSNMLFVVGTSSFLLSFFLVLYTIDILVYREITKLYDAIRKLKVRDFSISRKSILKTGNPFKKLNDEIFVYVARKQKEIDELKKMEQFRREFLADVSHELKTPIFAAQGFIHTLIDGAVDDEFVRDKFLAKAARSLDGLDLLVQDLVALSQLETGELKMHFDRVDIRQVVENIFEQLESLANARQTVLKIKAVHPGSVWVKADRQRITQVMTNLIQNAVKYGNEQGKVVVSLEEDGKKHIQIAVKDDGPGIPPEHLNRIFERFYRVEKSRSKEQGGTGLGLAIVKHILNAHKTKITVTSRLEKGTEFRFKLDKEL